MDRRSFLDPRHVTELAGPLLGALEALPDDDGAAPVVEVPLLRFGHRAMATTFEVILPFGTPGALAAAQAVFDLVDRLETQLSVYRETSEVSRLNRTALYAPIPVEEGLFDLLTLSARLTAATGGTFDVTAGALTKAWGFFRGPRRVPEPGEVAEALARTGMRHVTLDPERHTVRYLRRGLEVNLGSIGKGYALDRAAALLRTVFPTALLHGGSSSVLAIGSEPGSRRGWPVGLLHPWDPGRRLGVVWLRDQALGTSAATHRHLEYNGRKLGHTLDPRTGWPGEGVATASAVAPTAAEADALATAFYLLGEPGTRAYCEAHPEVGAVILPEGAERPVVMNLPPRDLMLT